MLAAMRQDALGQRVRLLGDQASDHSRSQEAGLSKKLIIVNDLNRWLHLFPSARISLLIKGATASTFAASFSARRTSHGSEQIAERRKGHAKVQG
ncbi:hypothetical protein FIM10_14600 [Sphingomonadales bacterium 56]|uniref:hypothetical protein n=1 Tax=unclassified Sphingobium TaxID=2611147 RepID=UPI001918709A|nr:MULTISPECIES: hypothetical protein [unclassified Sphingobium]MBY2929903.1 hypothetical protein [Sphingomonadales bacterium 56]MBY2959848.1 hypothetical protein [Sphingomonadales bacterium 58]